MVSARNVLRDEPWRVMVRPRLILADDHALFVEACRKLLEPCYQVVATVTDGRSLVEIAPRIKPDVIVADIGMPLMNGLEAGLRVKQKMPNVKLVFLTMHDDPELAVKAMRSGASGYLLKTSGASELIKAIQMALECKRYVTPRIARRMEKSFIEDPPASGRSKVLTARQREVLELLCSGKTMKEAASILNVSERTIGFHKYRVMSRFNLRSNAELVRFAASQQAIIV